MFLPEYPQKCDDGVWSPRSEPQTNDYDDDNGQPQLFLPLLLLLSLPRGEADDEDSAADTYITEDDDSEWHHPGCHEEPEDEKPIVFAFVQVVEAAARQEALGDVGLDADSRDGDHGERRRVQPDEDDPDEGSQPCCVIPPVERVCDHVVPVQGYCCQCHDGAGTRHSTNKPVCLAA